jgi:hypothetical protein
MHEEDVLARILRQPTDISMIAVPKHTEVASQSDKIT